MAAIGIDRLVVNRSGQPVLRGISCEVSTGTVTGLLGPSGCGKTTLLRSIVGVQIIESGAITVLGEPAGSLPLRRRVGYLTQAPSVYSDLSVRENLHYFRRVLGAPEPRVDQVIASVSLEQYADRMTSTLSGGQRARVSLATAMLGEPELLVLDEPTVGLDPVLRRDLWEQFAQMAATGVTLLISSHVMDEAEHCQSLLLMREGELIARTTPAELRADTGAANLEDAFLELIERQERS